MGVGRARSNVMLKSPPLEEEIQRSASPGALLLVFKAMKRSRGPTSKALVDRVKDDAAKYILEKTVTDRSYGARPLRRALQKYVEDPLSEAIIQGSLPRPAEFDVYLGDTGIFCRQIVEQPVGVGAPGEEVLQPAGTPLYLF